MPSWKLSHSDHTMWPHHVTRWLLSITNVYPMATLSWKILMYKYWCCQVDTNDCLQNVLPLSYMIQNQYSNPGSQRMAFSRTLWKSFEKYSLLLNTNVLKNIVIWLLKLEFVLVATWICLGKWNLTLSTLSNFNGLFHSLCWIELLQVCSVERDKLNVWSNICHPFDKSDSNRKWHHQIFPDMSNYVTFKIIFIWCSVILCHCRNVLIFILSPETWTKFKFTCYKIIKNHADYLLCGQSV